MVTSQERSLCRTGAELRIRDGGMVTAAYSCVLIGFLFPLRRFWIAGEICSAQTHRAHARLSHRWPSCLSPQSCLMAVGDISQSWLQRMWPWPGSINSAQLNEVPQGTMCVGRKNPQVIHTLCYSRTLTLTHMALLISWKGLLSFSRLRT